MEVNYCPFPLSLLINARDCIQKCSMGKSGKNNLQATEPKRDHWLDQSVKMHALEPYEVLLSFAFLRAWSNEWLK